MSEISGKAFDFRAFRRILEYLRPYKALTWVTILSSIVLSVLAPVMPVFIKYIEDTTIKLGNPSGFPFLLNMCVLLFAVLLVRSVIQFLNTYFTSLLGQNIIKDMRIKLYKHILELKLQFFDRTRSPNNSKGFTRFNIKCNAF